MCVEIKKQCECGEKEAQFHLRDNIISQEVIDRLYCPSCSEKLNVNEDTMLKDNGWIIEYDLDLATKRWDEVNKKYEYEIYRKWGKLKSSLFLIEEVEGEIDAAKAEKMDVTKADAKIKEARTLFEIDGKYAAARLAAADYAYRMICEPRRDVIGYKEQEIRRLGSLGSGVARNGNAEARHQ